MTNVTTANTTITTQDILDVTPLNGDLRIEIDGVIHYVVGADEDRNIIFVDATKDVCTDQTVEICLDDFESLEVIYLGSYALYKLVKGKQFDLPNAIVKNCTPRALNILVGEEEVIDLAPAGITPRCTQSVDKDLELPF